MPICLRLRSPNIASQSFQFSDEELEIRIGRDSLRCQISLPAEALMVSREHCALQRVLGRYRLLLNGENSVRVDGRPAYDSEVLPAQCKLQIGVDGPVLHVEVAQASELDPTALAKSDRVLHVGKQVDRIARRGRFAAAAIAAIGLALLCVAYAGWKLVAATEENLGGELASAREFLRAEIVASERRTAEQSRAMEAVVQRATQSVHLVLIENDAGVQSAAGTAWVCGVAMLATNAHVAQLFNQIPSGWKLLVRSSGPEPLTHCIERVSIHPAYALFEELNSNYRPQVSAAMGWDEDVRLVTACDVALLFVDGKAFLPEALPLADPESLLALEPGREVGFAGFPTEGLLNVHLQRPEPVVQIGRVTSTSDFFFGAAVPEDSQLVHFSMPATGGASGSPILDASGRVVSVLCAGNVQRVVTGFSLQRDRSGSLVGLEPVFERSPLAVGVNFSQRIDLLLELVRGEADQRQELRRRKWTGMFSQYLSTSFGPDEIAAHAWRTRFGPAAQLPAPELRRNDVVRSGGPVNATILALEGLAPGRYYVLAISEARQDIDMHVLRGSGRTWSKRELADERPNHWPQALIEVEEGKHYAVAVFTSFAEAAGSDFELRVYRVAD